MQKSRSVVTANIFVPVDPSPRSTLIKCSFPDPSLYNSIVYVNSDR